MEKRKIYLLQDTEEQNAKLRENFISDQRFEIVGESTDGENAVSALTESQADVLILELVMSGYDGLSLIESIKKLNMPVKLIVVSALKRDEIIRMTIEAGADYFMAKPCNFEVLKERILELFEEREILSRIPSPSKTKWLDERLGNLFINVGIPPHIKGYGYLREGIKLAISRPEIVNNITKQLYPTIARIFNTTSSKVERAIRHAIEVAFNRGRIDSINNILGVRAFVSKEKPTNGEFIALIADKIMLELA